MHFTMLLRQWRQRQSAVRELDALGTIALGELARDNALQETDLYSLASRDRADAGLLPRLLGAVGLNPDELSQRESGVMRDMAVVCSGCAMLHRCRKELDRRHAAECYRAYCPNAETIDALRSDLHGPQELRQGQSIAATRMEPADPGRPFVPGP